MRDGGLGVLPCCEKIERKSLALHSFFGTGQDFLLNGSFVVEVTQQLCRSFAGETLFKFRQIQNCIR